MCSYPWKFFTKTRPTFSKNISRGRRVSYTTTVKAISVFWDKLVPLEIFFEFVGVETHSEAGWLHNYGKTFVTIPSRKIFTIVLYPLSKKLKKIPSGSNYTVLS